MSEKALEITEKTGSYLLEPASWGYSAYDYGAIAAYRLGMYDRSYALAIKALAMQPDDARLRQNLELIKAKLGDTGATS
jgi:tetratricopeptide (TPR) repeat protein